MYSLKHKRPSHAIESAFLAEELLESHLLPILEVSFDTDEEQIENIFGVIQLTYSYDQSKAYGRSTQDEKLTIA